MSSVHVAIVSTRRTSVLARLSASRATRALPDAHVHVLDADDSYRAVSNETVLSPVQAGLPIAEVHRQAVVLDPEGLVRWLSAALTRTLLFNGVEAVESDRQVRDRSSAHADARTRTVLVLGAGVVLLARPDDLIAGARAAGLSFVPRSTEITEDDDLWPETAAVARAGAWSANLFAVRGPGTALLRVWDCLAREPSGVGDRWLDVAAGALEHGAVRDAATLVSAWNLTSAHRIEPLGSDRISLDGRPVVAVDLSAFDPREPWLLDATVPHSPRARLSDHPHLARFVEHIVGELADLRSYEGTGERHSAWDTTRTSLGTPVDEALRSVYRTAARGGERATPTPDPFLPADHDRLLEWLAAPTAEGGPGRYLRAIHATRPDLQAAFPGVPGPAEQDFLAWVSAHGTREYPTVLVEPALAATTRPRRAVQVSHAPGVNVVGYLRGELGIGESARLMARALEAAGVPHAEVPVDSFLMSRQRAPEDSPREQPVFDTTLLCVNADLTPAVARTVPSLLARSYRIGMWYWEVEEFPETQHGGFSHLDEVWVASDFIRDAVEPHSPVPVRTVTPPLPQRRAPTALTREELGLPDRPLFLFSFDYLSTAERKNPLGLLAAFRRAFRPDEGPVLVIKSINSDQRPSEAERLRLAAYGSNDVLLLEEYLDAEARDALVELCDCYVSLHRSEGLGLTMAEAMAWGKPVIATAYSGNLQFMTDENSFLVPWSPVRIPEGAEPYPAGGLWADPDLDAAARFMRSVVENPDLAAAMGARAAADIALLHSPTVAGALIAARLAETTARRRARSRIHVVSRLQDAARQARRTLR